MQRPLTNNVGAGLLANRVYQLMHLWLTHRIREQARSHSQVVACQVDTRRSPERYRRQASSHNWVV